MRTLTRTGLMIAAAVFCVAALPRTASAHTDAVIRIVVRYSGVHLRIRYPLVYHEPQRIGFGYRRERRLVERRDWLQRAAVRALRAGELREARRLFSRAVDLEARRRGRRAGRR